MAPKKLYCPTCQKHTMHVHQVEMYATRCLKCNTYTGQLERIHVENLNYTAPDGQKGIVVHNTPDKVVFYVEQGSHKGYYTYEKHTGKKQITPVV